VAARAALGLLLFSDAAGTASPATPWSRWLALPDCRLALAMGRPTILESTPDWCEVADRWPPAMERSKPSIAAPSGPGAAECEQPRLEP